MTEPRVLSRAPLALEQMIWLAMCNPTLWVCANGHVTNEREAHGWKHPAIAYKRFPNLVWSLDYAVEPDFFHFESTDELKRALDPLLRKVTHV